MFIFSSCMGAKASSVGLPPQSIKELQQHVDFTPEEIKTWYVCIASNGIDFRNELYCHIEASML